MSERDSFEVLGTKLDEIKKLVIGYFRFHESNQIELVLGYVPESHRVLIFSLNNLLAISSYSTFATKGVLVLFSKGENLYTLKTRKHVLEDALNKVQRASHRPSGLSAYLVPGK